MVIYFSTDLSAAILTRHSSGGLACRLYVWLARVKRTPERFIDVTLFAGSVSPDYSLKLDPIISLGNDTRHISHCCIQYHCHTNPEEVP